MVMGGFSRNKNALFPKDLKEKIVKLENKIFLLWQPI